MHRAKIHQKIRQVAKIALEVHFIENVYIHRSYLRSIITPIVVEMATIKQNPMVFGDVLPKNFSQKNVVLNHIPGIRRKVKGCAAKKLSK